MMLLVGPIGQIVHAQDPDDGIDAEDFTVGLQYFMKKHNARGGIEFRSGDSADQILGGIQFLL